MKRETMRQIIWIILIIATSWNWLIGIIVAEDMPVYVSPIPILPILSFIGLLLDTSDKAGDHP